MKNMHIKYPNTLREHRVKSGLTQKEVAAILGMQCEDRLSHWEKGTSIPSLINLFKLSKLYKVSIEKIYPFFK